MAIDIEWSHEQMAVFMEGWAEKSRSDAAWYAKKLAEAEASATSWDALAAYHREQQEAETGKEKVV